MPHSTIHVLVISAWLPSKRNPAAGIFVFRQANALNALPDVTAGIIGRRDLATLSSSPVHVTGIERALIANKMYIPKAGQWLIDLWGKQYLDIFDSYTKKYGRPDIIHAHSYVAGFAARYFSHVRGIPFVLTEHATAVLAQQIPWYHKRALRSVLQNAAALIAVGKGLQQALHVRSKRDVLLIPNCYDASVFKRINSQIRGNGRTLITAGSLIPRKRVSLLLRAFAAWKNRTPGDTLVIVGNGPKKGSLVHLARGSGIDTAVRWIPYASPETLADIFNKADLYVSTSALETFGITILEAMACGLPVLCTRSGGPEDFVKRDHGVLLENDATPDTIASAIDEILTNDRRHDPAAIAEYAYRNFSGEEIAKRIHEVYRNILTAHQDS